MKNYFYAAIAFSLICCGCGNGDKKAAKQPIRVKTEVVNNQNENPATSFIGIVEEREATAVSFTSMGVVKRVLVSEGQPVQRGQLLAVMDASTANNTAEAAQAMTNQAHDMVAQAENVYAQTKDAYDRMKILHDNGSLPEIKWIEIETQLRQAETALQTARSGVRSATATERIARKSVSDTRLTAPVSGIVGRHILAAGETAMPSQAIVTILDITTVKVRVSIPESEIGAIQPNTHTTIEVDAVGKKVQGGRIEKGVQADAFTHTYDILVNVPNPDRKLLPGMIANVMIEGIGNAGNQVITLPVTSVQGRTDGSHFVWTVDTDGTAHRTPVKIGNTVGNRVVINSGVHIQQRVVVEGYQKLSEGTKVIY